MKILLGVFIVFVKTHLDILLIHIPDEPMKTKSANKEKHITTQRSMMTSSIVSSRKCHRQLRKCHR